MYKLNPAKIRFEKKKKVRSFLNRSSNEIIQEINKWTQFTVVNCDKNKYSKLDYHFYGISSHRTIAILLVCAEKPCRNFGEIGILKYWPLADIGQAGDSVPSVTLNIKS